MKSNLTKSIGNLRLLPRPVSSLPKFDRDTVRSWVVYKDADFLVINKPPKVPLHTANRSDAGVLFYHFLKFSCSSNPIPCHFLDADVSGALLLARSSDVYRVTVERIRTGQFWSRLYWAVLEGVGVNKRKGGIITLPCVARTSESCFVPSGYTGGSTKTMVTQWQRRNYSRKYGCSCVELRPLASDENERHQLAAHCAYELGSPILGDTKYKKLSTLWAAARGSPLGATSRSARRLPEIEQNLYLHHRSITFEGSMGTRVDIVCPLPAQMEQLFETLGWEHYHNTIRNAASQQYAFSSPTYVDSEEKNSWNPAKHFDENQKMHELLLSGAHGTRSTLKPLVLRTPSTHNSKVDEQEFPQLR